MRGGGSVVPLHALVREGVGDSIQGLPSKKARRHGDRPAWWYKMHTAKHILDGSTSPFLLGCTPNMHR